MYHLPMKYVIIIYCKCVTVQIKIKKQKVDRECPKGPKNLSDVRALSSVVCNKKGGWNSQVMESFISQVKG